MESPPRIKPRSLTAALAIAALSLILLAIAALAALWQQRLTDSWEQAAMLPAEGAALPAARGRALWIMHPSAPLAGDDLLLPIDTPHATSTSPWKPVPGEQALALLLAGLTPAAPEALEATAAQPGQPAPPYALIAAAARAERRVTGALPLVMSARVAASDGVTILASEAPQLGELIEPALAADGAALLVVWVDADAWTGETQQGLAALADQALRDGWLVVASALPLPGQDGLTIQQTMYSPVTTEEAPSFASQDLAPTIAWWLGLAPLPLAEGRPLAELLSATPDDWAAAELAAATQAQGRASARLAPIDGLVPPQVTRDLAAAQAALSAGNWRGARQLARLARNSALAAERSQRATAWQRQRLNRGVLAAVAAFTLAYGLLLLAGRRGWPTLHAGSVGAAVLGVWLIAAPSSSAWSQLANGRPPLPAVIAAAATVLVALTGGLLLERRSLSELWYDMALGALWLVWLALVPLGWLFTAAGAWQTWLPPRPEHTALMHRLLGALTGAALAGAILPALVTALLGSAQTIWWTVRRAVYAHLEANHAHRHHR